MSKLLKWFLVWIVAMIALILFTLPNERPEKINTVSFETTESAELYFKNVRIFYYSTQPEGQGVFDAFRLNSIFNDSTQILLPFTLYSDWRQNRAFVRLDTTRYKRQHSFELVADSGGAITSSYAFPGQTNEAQFIFARVVYKALKAQRRVGVVGPNSDTLWLEPSNAAAVRQTLKDYFRLVGKI